MTDATTRKCANCERAFTPALRRIVSRQEQRFCSARCRVASHRKGQPEAVRAIVERVTPELRELHSPTDVTRLRGPDLSGTKTAIRRARPALQMTFGGYAIVPDLEWSCMYRIRRPDGSLTDMANLSRARDAARHFADQERRQELPMVA
jgi:hypothetical protein